MYGSSIAKLRRRWLSRQHWYGRLISSCSAARARCAASNSFCFGLVAREPEAHDIDTTDTDCGLGWWKVLEQNFHFRFPVPIFDCIFIRDPATATTTTPSAGQGKAGFESREIGADSRTRITFNPCSGMARYTRRSGRAK